ncbi:MAG TPA: hypothetical protein VHZ55_03080 [Bryobacteraceae bacterium]|jgi:hypothetical protein|nr:hypothetical protein [Bryobacteraceae bacterium]
MNAITTTLVLLARVPSGMRRDTEYFGEIELDLVYMARTLRDALKLEQVLTDEGVEYLVETGTYVAGLLMKRDLTGAFFYVTPDDVERTRAVLLNNRYTPYAAERMK